VVEPEGRPRTSIVFPTVGDAAVSSGSSSASEGAVTKLPVRSDAESS
jgi:hypothetical protein